MLDETIREAGRAVAPPHYLLERNHQVLADRLINRNRPICIPKRAAAVSTSTSQGLRQEERAWDGVMWHEWSSRVRSGFCALFVCIAILKITNARSLFSAGEAATTFMRQPERRLLLAQRRRMRRPVQLPTRPLRLSLTGRAERY